MFARATVCCLCSATVALASGCNARDDDAQSSYIQFTAPSFALADEARPWTEIFSDLIASEHPIITGKTFRGRMGDAGHALANIERGLLMHKNNSKKGYELALRNSIHLTQSLQDCRILLAHEGTTSTNKDPETGPMIAFLTACHALASWCEWSLLQGNFAEVENIIQQLKILRTDGHDRYATIYNTVPNRELRPVLVSRSSTPTWLQGAL